MTSLAFIPNSSLLVKILGNSVCFVYDYVNLKPVRLLSKSENKLKSVCCSENLISLETADGIELYSWDDASKEALLLETITWRQGRSSSISSLFAKNTTEFNSPRLGSTYLVDHDPRFDDKSGHRFNVLNLETLVKSDLIVPFNSTASPQRSQKKSDHFPNFLINRSGQLLAVHSSLCPFTIYDIVKQKVVFRSSLLPDALLQCASDDFLVFAFLEGTNLKIVKVHDFEDHDTEPTIVSLEIDDFFPESLTFRQIDSIQHVQLITRSGKLLQYAIQR